MNTITLYRPVGLTELRMIMQSGWKAFPPRLEWQPIFYPVMNEDYAIQIAQQWNVADAFSGYCGVVTRFSISADYCKQFPVQNVGGQEHNELWVPAEELPAFNSHIQGCIEVSKVFTGEGFVTPDDELKELFG